MNIETRDVKVHRLEFTDDELARIIADPNEFVAELVRRMPASDGVNKPAAQKRAKKWSDTSSDADRSTAEDDGLPGLWREVFDQGAGTPQAALSEVSG